MEKGKEAATCEHTFRWGKRKGTPCGAKAIPLGFGWPFCRTHAPWRKKAKEIVENREIMADFGVEEDFWNEEEDIEEWVKEMSKLPEKPDRDPWVEAEEKERETVEETAGAERPLHERNASYLRKAAEKREEWRRLASEAEISDRYAEMWKEEARSGATMMAEEPGRGSVTG